MLKLWILRVRSLLLACLFLVLAFEPDEEVWRLVWPAISVLTASKTFLLEEKR